MDEYTEVWENLRGIRMVGKAELLTDGNEYVVAKRLMFRKYSYQYKHRGWVDGVNVVIKITPTRATSWRATSPTSASPSRPISSASPARARPTSRSSIKA